MLACYYLYISIVLVKQHVSVNNKMSKLSQEFLSKFQYILVYYLAIGLFFIIYPQEDSTDALNIFEVSFISTSGLHTLGIFDAFVIIGLPIVLLYFLHKFGFKPETNSRALIQFPNWYEYILFYGLAVAPVIYMFYSVYKLSASM